MLHFCSLKIILKYDKGYTGGKVSRYCSDVDEKADSNPLVGQELKLFSADILDRPDIRPLKKITDENWFTFKYKF